jgi:hypothetical protein
MSTRHHLGPTPRDRPTFFTTSLHILTGPLSARVQHLPHRSPVCQGGQTRFIWKMPNWAVSPHNERTGFCKISGLKDGSNWADV